MSTMYIRFFGFLLLFIVGAYLMSTPLALHAQSAETPFGGMHLFSQQCTCASDSLEFILDYRTNTLLKLLYEQGQSKLYDNNNVKATYQLGTYSSANGQACKIEAGEDCEDINADGIYGSQPGTGTSFMNKMKGFFAGLAKKMPFLILRS